MEFSSTVFTNIREGHGGGRINTFEKGRIHISAFLKTDLRNFMMNIMKMTLRGWDRYLKKEQGRCYQLKKSNMVMK